MTMMMVVVFFSHFVFHVYQHGLVTIDIQITCKAGCNNHVLEQGVAYAVRLYIVTSRLVTCFRQRGRESGRRREGERERERDGERETEREAERERKREWETERRREREAEIETER